MDVNKSQKMKETLKSTTVRPPRGESDTLRLWEAYLDQAILWRAIALLQIPSTLALLVFSMWLYGGRTIVLNVPQKPLPGQYTVDQLTDPILVDAATDFINLISSYTPKTARRQMQEAEQRVVEPLLTTFTQDMIETDLKAIEQTQRSQLFLIDPTKTSLTRGRGNATVTFEGDRVKIVSGKEFPASTLRYLITMETRPRNRLNEYGVVITGIRFEKTTEDG